MSQTFEALKQASAHDTQWEIRNYALGETATAREINVMSSNVFSSFRKPSEHDTEMFKHENKVVGQERVEIRRLADIVEELGVTRQLDRVFLKSDTQGYDMQVLRGAGVTSRPSGCCRWKCR